MKTVALAALALGVTMMPGFAQETLRPRPEAAREKMVDRLERSLNLTDAQKASVKEIRGRHKGALEAGRAKAQDAHKAFMEAYRKADAKPEDLKALHRASADANLDLLLEHRAQRLEIRALLTPEQREKAARLEGRMEGRWMGRRGGFPGHDAR